MLPSSNTCSRISYRQRCCAGHTGRVFDLDFACGLESNFLASASDDNSVKLWQVDIPDQSRIASPILRCEGHQDSVLRVKWNAEGTLIASGRECIIRCQACISSELTCGLQVLPTPQFGCGRSLTFTLVTLQVRCKLHL